MKHATLLLALVALVGCSSPPRPVPAPPAQCLVIHAFDPKTGTELTPPYSVQAGGQIQFTADFEACHTLI